MQIAPPVNSTAMLKNVALFSTLIKEVVEQPNMACFHGFSGYGKSQAAVYGANRYRAAYVECDLLTSAKSLLVLILNELGVARPRGTASQLKEEAVKLLARDPGRPLIIDEVHHIAHKQFVELTRTLHMQSGAPVILIGEETLPIQLKTIERVHNRIAIWQPALPCDREDFEILARSMFPKLAISDELADRILKETRGNTCRISMNLAAAERTARITGNYTLDSSTVGRLVDSEAPTPRRAA